MKVTKKELVDVLQNVTSKDISNDVKEITVENTGDVLLDGQKFVHLTKHQVNVLKGDDGYHWRPMFKRKLKTKSWFRVDFVHYLQEVIYYDDNTNVENIPLATVIEELIWRWVLLNDKSWGGYNDYSNTEKINFKKVTNNFLDKFGDSELVSKSYLKYSNIKIDDEGKIKLI